MKPLSTAECWEAMGPDIKQVYDLVDKIIEAERRMPSLLPPLLDGKLAQAHAKRAQRKAQELVGLDDDAELELCMKIDSETVKDRAQIRIDHDKNIVDLANHLQSFGQSLATYAQEICKLSSLVRSVSKQANVASKLPEQTNTNAPKVVNGVTAAHPTLASSALASDGERSQVSCPKTSAMSSTRSTQTVIDEYFGLENQHYEIVEYPQRSNERYILYCEEHQFNPTLLAGIPDKDQYSSLGHAVAHLRTEHQPLAGLYGYTDAILIMGISVPECTAEQETQHNIKIRDTLVANKAKSLGVSQVPMVSSQGPDSQNSASIKPLAWHIYAAYDDIEREHTPILVMDPFGKVSDTCWFETDDILVFKSQLSQCPPGVQYDAQLGEFMGWTETYQEGQHDFPSRWYPAISFNGPTFERRHLRAIWVNVAKISAYSERYATERTRLRWNAVEQFRLWTCTKTSHPTIRETNTRDKAHQSTRTSPSVLLASNSSSGVSNCETDRQRPTGLAEQRNSATTSQLLLSNIGDIGNRNEMASPAPGSKRAGIHGKPASDKRVMLASIEGRSNDVLHGTQQVPSVIQLRPGGEAKERNTEKQISGGLRSGRLSHEAEHAEISEPTQESREACSSKLVSREANNAPVCAQVEANEAQHERPRRNIKRVQWNKLM